MKQSTIRVYDPTAAPRVSGAGLTPRPTTLNGVTIGVLDNGKANAGLLMTSVAQLMQERYGVAAVLVRRKPVAGPASAEVIADLKRECAAVLVGSAD